MECKKLERKLQNWARGLSFKLADGSAPPTNYFTLLTSTPHRRQLWETLMELIQPRKKVEHMRKQILVAKLRDKQKISRKIYLGMTDRIDLWNKQNELENKVESKKKEVLKLEENIIIKASDMLFEICTLSETENFHEEYNERELALQLLTKRERYIIKSLEKLMYKAVGSDSSINFLETTTGKEISGLLKKEFFIIKDCQCLYDDAHCCGLVYKIKKLYLPAMKEKNLWKEMIKYKKSLLENFYLFFSDISLREKIILSKRELEIEENQYALIVQLRQKITEKALQMILNSAEERPLINEIERQTENLLLGTEKVENHLNSLEEIFNEAISPIKENERSECLAELQKVNVVQVRSVMQVLGLKSYESHLREEKQRIDNEVVKIEKDKRSKDEWKNKESSKKTYPTEISHQSFKCLVEEIFRKRSEEKVFSRNLVRIHERLIRAQRLWLEGTEENKKTRAAENVESLKSYSRKLIQDFLESPLNALKTVRCTDRRQPFERTSLSPCFSCRDGELKQFLSNLLIPPEEKFQVVLSVVGRRQKSSAEIVSVIRQREELTRRQEKAGLKMSSIKWNTKLCERNFNNCNAILWNVLANAEEVPKRIDLIEKILTNWYGTNQEGGATLQIHDPNHLKVLIY